MTQKNRETLVIKRKKLREKAVKISEKRKKLREKAVKIREELSELQKAISKDKKGLIKYKGQWIREGNSKDKEKVDKRAKNAGEKAESKKKIYTISKLKFMKKYSELSKREKLSVDSEFEKYKNLPRREIEKIFLRKNLTNHLKNKKMTPEELMNKFDKNVFGILVEFEKEGVVKYVDDKWMLA
tara:strand:- start:3666 stop:4217 length:552 start_codon:yes stop_codon:yes gene_type:complete